MNRVAKFVVEDVCSITGQGYVVFAKRLDDTEFWINESTKLHGARVRQGDIPRKLDEQGKPRLDLWGFYLTDDADHERFQVGTVIDLEFQSISE